MIYQSLYVTTDGRQIYFCVKRRKQTLVSSKQDLKSLNDRCGLIKLLPNTKVNLNDNLKEYSDFCKQFHFLLSLSFDVNATFIYLKVRLFYG